MSDRSPDKDIRKLQNQVKSVYSSQKPCNISTPYAETAKLQEVHIIENDKHNLEKLKDFRLQMESFQKKFEELDEEIDHKKAQKKRTYGLISENSKYKQLFQLKIAENQKADHQLSRQRTFKEQLTSQIKAINNSQLKQRNQDLSLLLINKKAQAARLLNQFNLKRKNFQADQRRTSAQLQDLAQKIQVSKKKRSQFTQQKLAIQQELNSSNHLLKIQQEKLTNRQDQLLKCQSLNNQLSQSLRDKQTTLGQLTAELSQKYAEVSFKINGQQKERKQLQININSMKTHLLKLKGDLKQSRMKLQSQIKVYKGQQGKLSEICTINQNLKSLISKLQDQEVALLKDINEKKIILAGINSDLEETKRSLQTQLKKQQREWKMNADMGKQRTQIDHKYLSEIDRIDSVIKQIQLKRRN